MISQRIEAIQLEMDKGETADYGQFRPGGKAADSKGVSNGQTASAGLGSRQNDGQGTDASIAGSNSAQNEQAQEAREQNKEEIAAKSFGRGR